MPFWRDDLVWDDEGTWSEEHSEHFKAVEQGKESHQKDAAIYDSCHKNGCVLVTNDKALASKARNGLEVLSVEEFLREPDVLVPSGIEWIGWIPEEWKE